MNARAQRVNVDPNARVWRPTSGLRSSRYPFAHLFAVFLFFIPFLRAHDVYTSWTEAIVRSDKIELTLTLGRASAVRLLSKANSRPSITAENFPDYAPRLKAVAAELFEITAAGKQLTLKSSEVKISGDADVTFHLTYPRPSSDVLRFAVNYLFQLVDGHVGTLVVTDASGKDLGWSPVSVDQPGFEVRLPAISAPK